MGLYQKLLLPKILNFTMGSKEIEKLRPEVINLASGVVLEIGVGSGYNLPFYKNVSKLYALEPSRELIKLAEQRTKDLLFPVEFLNSKAENIPLSDDSVDCVISTWTLCSISEPDRALKEIGRVLRKNGRFIFIDHGISPNPFLCILQQILTPFMKYFTGNCHLDRDIKKLILEAKFTMEKFEQFYENTKLLKYNSKGVGVINKSSSLDTVK